MRPACLPLGGQAKNEALPWRVASRKARRGRKLGGPPIGFRRVARVFLGGGCGRCAMSSHSESLLPQQRYDILGSIGALARPRPGRYPARRRSESRIPLELHAAAVRAGGREVRGVHPRRRHLPGCAQPAAGGVADGPSLRDLSHACGSSIPARSCSTSARPA